MAQQKAALAGDTDGDGVLDVNDNCVSFYNPDQADRDGDGIGDVCDQAPNTYDPTNATVSQVDAAGNLVISNPPTGILPVYSTPAAGSSTTIGVTQQLGGGGGGVTGYPLAQVVVPVVAVLSPMPSVVLAQQSASSQSASFRVVIDPTYTANPATQSATSYAAYDIELSRSYASALTTWSDPNANQNDANPNLSEDGNLNGPNSLAGNIFLTVPVSATTTAAFAGKTFAMEFYDTSVNPATVIRIPDCRSDHYYTDGRCAQVYEVYAFSNGGSVTAGYRVSVWSKITFGCLINVQSNPSNCGACGVHCSNVNIANPTCANGVCNGACNAGYADCKNNKQLYGCETHIAADPNNCGGCGIAANASATPANSAYVCNSAGSASGSATCSNGVCTCTTGGTCASGYANCNNTCQVNGCNINLNTNTSNCGACGTVCSPQGITQGLAGAGLQSGSVAGNLVCSAGSCNASTCATGYGDCNNNKQVDGCEIDTWTNTSDCGGCGIVCNPLNLATNSCTQGVCTGTCAGGFAHCSGNFQATGCETNVTNNVNNCGGCGLNSNASATPASSPYICASDSPWGASYHITASCQNESCNYGTCDTGYAACSGTKQANGCNTNIYTNTSNCGSCGTVCSSNEVTPTCTNGSCVCTTNGTSPCASGYGNCNGTCQANGCNVALNTTSNCGACNVVCPSGYNCTNGSCVAAVGVHHIYTYYNYGSSYSGWDIAYPSFSCPTGATTYNSADTPAEAATDPNAAYAACIACYGGACSEYTGDCAGYAYGFYDGSAAESCDNGAICAYGGDVCMGWQSGCTGPAGRDWFYGESETMYGDFGIN